MKKTMLAVFAAGLLVATPSCKKGENDPGLSLKSRKARITADWSVDSYDDSSTSTNIYTDTDTDGELIKNVNVSTESYTGGSISSTSTNTNTYDGDGFFTTTSVVQETTAGGSVISNKTTTTDGSSTSYESTGIYASTVDWKVSFVKDGSFTMTKSTSVTTTYTTENSLYSLDTKTITTSSSTVSGTWSFVAKNKADEFKNKERISLWNQNNVVDTKAEVIYTYTDKDNSDGYDYVDDNETDISTNVNTYSDKDSQPSEIWELDMLKGKEMTAIRTYTNSNTGTSTSSNTAGGTTTSSNGVTNGSWEGNSTLKMTRIK